MYPVALLGRLLGVSPSGSDAFLPRKPSQRARADVVLAERIEAIHRWSSGTYGAPRIHEPLRDEGLRVGKKRVARLMHQAGLAGVSRRKGLFPPRADQDAAGAPDLVARHVIAEAPDRLWVAAIPDITTWAGFLYLAVVLAVCSRRVVGWPMACHLTTELVREALNMALWQRKAHGVLHQSDRGSQSTSIAFGLRCTQAGVRPSMGSAGDCFDNALCESFFATLECERLERQWFRTQAEARMAIFECIEGWDHPQRKHSALGYRSPLQYERRDHLNTQIASL